MIYLKNVVKMDRTLVVLGYEGDGAGDVENDAHGAWVNDDVNKQDFKKTSRMKRRS